ncbi:hypothetical protein GON15_32155 [Burkholderia contaminans]|nr:hypothetical protein GON15_32155 [Burkholderia contaminans]
MINQQPRQVDRGRIIAALERHGACLEYGPDCVTHRLLDRLLELRFELLTRFDLGPYRNQIGKHGRQASVVAEVDRVAMLRISAMVINRFGERDQSGRWCCAVNGL